MKWPAPDELRRRATAFAMLDAIFVPGSEDRYYTFNGNWQAGEHLLAIHNGSGDDAYLLFCAGGCIVKVFDHEAAARNDPWEGQLEAAQALVPEEYRLFLKEPAFELEYISDLIWWDQEDQTWFAALPDHNEPQTSFLLDHLVSLNPAEEYASWAEDYYEQPVSLESVKAIVEHQPLTQQIVNQLNDVELAALAADIVEIGYPVSR